jgi:hypothetical protein
MPMSAEVVSTMMFENLVEHMQSLGYAMCAPCHDDELDAQS